MKKASQKNGIGALRPECEGRTTNRSKDESCHCFSLDKINNNHQKNNTEFTMDEAHDIFKLIQSIVQDGELSTDEVFDIAAWLESRPADRKKWPGREIYAMLSGEMLAGKITNLQLRKFGAFLIGIIHERASKDNLNVVKTSRTLVDDCLIEFNAKYPVLPSIGIVADVASETHSGVKYLVDLTYPLCSCPNGQKRSDLPRGNLNRCCKHVFSVYSQLRPRSGWPHWLDGYLANAKPSSCDTHWFVIQTSPPTLVGVYDSEWCDVFAPKRTLYDRFGYNRFEERWSYGMHPKDSDYIESEIAIYLTAWNKTSFGIENAERTQLALEARHNKIESSIAERKQFLSELCGNDYADKYLSNGTDEALLLKRVLRPINEAISQTFKTTNISEQDRLTLQIAIAHSPYLESLPLYGPNSTWDQLNEGGISNKVMSKDLRMCVAYTAFECLAPDIFIALQAKGISSYKKSLDDYLIKKDTN
jgi:hypothetical protein